MIRIYISSLKYSHLDIAQIRMYTPNQANTVDLTNNKEIKFINVIQNHPVFYFSFHNKIVISDSVSFFKS